MPRTLITVTQTHAFYILIINSTNSITNDPNSDYFTPYKAIGSINHHSFSLHEKEQLELSSKHLFLCFTENNSIQVYKIFG